MKDAIIGRGRLIRAADAADRSMDAILSTTSVALDGHRVLGWEHPKSVPLIDTHMDMSSGVRSVIGRVTPRWDGVRLVGRLDFATADVNPDAELAFQLCRGGFVTAVSVSFVPVEWSYARGDDRLPGAMDVSLARLLEASVCAVGSDPNAKILARALRAQGTSGETTADRGVRARAMLARYRREARAQSIVEAASRDVEQLRTEPDPALARDRALDAWLGRRGLY